MHTGNGVVERAIQTIENLIIANMEDGLCLTESVNRALRVMRFTIHTGLKITPIELHHGRKPRTELTNIVKNGKTYLSNWSEMTISAPDRPKIPIYVGRDAEGEIIWQNLGKNATQIMIFLPHLCERKILSAVLDI